MAKISPPSNAQKTKVLFAFGRHGTETKPADTDFFRSAVEPFLEEHVVRGGKKAVVVHELVVYEKFSCCPELINTAIDLMLSEPDKSNTKELGKIMERIRNIQHDGLQDVNWNLRQLDHGAWPLGFHRWGFEDLMMRLNSKAHRTIRNVAEQQEPENIIALFEADRIALTWESMAGNMNIHEDVKLRVLTELYKKIVVADRLRDICILKQIGRLARKDPSLVIIVPRGSLHFPMIYLADRTKFDIDARYGLKGNIDKPSAWMIKAIAGYYMGKLDDKQLTQFLAQHMNPFDEMHQARKKPKVIEF